MTYGERQGVGHRVGGWGELFGDEGSAYWIATQGLNAFSRMSDGRLPHGPLHQLMKDRLQVAGDLDVVSLVIDTWKGNRSKIAALATTVCEAARTGDEASARILSAAADELVTLIETTRTLVGFTDEETVPVSYSGGMFSDDGFRDAVRHRAAEATRQVRPATSAARPGGGRRAVRRQAQRTSIESRSPATPFRQQTDEVKSP